MKTGLNKIVSWLYICFVIFCVALLLAAYILELKLAFAEEIPPTLGTLLVCLPVSSFAVANILRSYQESLTNYPRVLVLRNINSFGIVGIPAGWRAEAQKGYLRVWDDCGAARILGKTVSGQALSTPPILPWSEETAVQPLSHRLPDGNEIKRCTFVVEKKRYSGFIGMVSTGAGEQFLLYFIHAGKADLPVIQEMIEYCGAADQI